jgi:PPK2 family polyphosphate:nucleotide phosphotransferase
VSRSRRDGREPRILDGRDFAFADHDPAAVLEEAEERLERGVARLAKLQGRLWAQDRWSLLLVFQGMDASGKDGVIKHVFRGVDPLGCETTAFKAPHAEELDHTWLWRVVKRLPERGRSGVWNRSHYEEVVAVRANPRLLAAQKLPSDLVGAGVWDERLDDIAAFERHLARNGVRVAKFMLHISKDEQRRRLFERIEDPAKNWKFALSDLDDRAAWDAHHAAYEAAIRATAAPHAPWWVVPADDKPSARAMVVEAVVDLLEGLDLSTPSAGEAKRRELEEGRRRLDAGG